MGLLTSLRAILPACSAVIVQGAAHDTPQERLLAPSLEMVRRVVACIPNTDATAPTRDDFVKMGYAIRGSLPDALAEEAYDIWAGPGSWAQRWTHGTNDPDLCEREWGRMKRPYKVGWSWLSEMAEKHSGGAWTRGEPWFEEPSNVVPLFPVDRENRTTAAGRFVIERGDDVAREFTGGSRGYLVKGLLDRGAMSVVYGPSNIGKTFVCLDIAYAVAQGRSYGGMRMHQAPVLYIVMEGGRTGVPRRLEALRRRHGPCDAFYVLRTTVNLFDPAADVPALLADVAALGVSFGLIVVDTLARAMAGGDENLAKDMGQFVANADRLRALTAAHILLVHHTGKDAANGARGSSALRAATDTEIELSEGQITVTKQRDIAGEWSSGFVLEPVDLGVDEDGDPIMQATVTLAVDRPAAGDARPALTPGERDVLSAMREAGEAGEPVKLGAVYELRGSTTKKEQDVVKKHVAALRTKGYLVRRGAGVWALRGGEDVEIEPPPGSGAAGWFEELG